MLSRLNPQCWTSSHTVHDFHTALQIINVGIRKRVAGCKGQRSGNRLASCPGWVPRRVPSCAITCVGSQQKHAVRLFLEYVRDYPTEVKSYRDDTDAALRSSDVGQGGMANYWPGASALAVIRLLADVEKAVAELDHNTPDFALNTLRVGLGVRKR